MINPSIAPPWRRFAAAGIEVLAAWVALSVVLVSASLPDDPDTWTTDETQTAGLIFFVFLTAWFNYLVIAEWRWGRTLGKLALDLRVVDEEGGRLAWNRSLVRNLLRLPDLVAAPFMIPASERRQRLGDRAAHSLVVRASAPVASVAPPGPGAPPESEALPPSTGSPPKASALTPPAWGPSRALGGLVVLLVILVIEAVIVGAFDPDLDSLAATLTLQALLAVTMVGVAFAVASREGALSPAAALGLRRPSRPAIGVSILAYLVYIGCALLIAVTIQPEQEDVTRDLGFGEGALGSIAAGFLIVVAAPISEEVFFRGFLFGGLRRGTGFLVAAVISAGIWGLFHYTDPDSWGVVLQLALFGVVLAWLYERTGSLWPPIALHCFNNALAFAILTS